MVDVKRREVEPAGLLDVAVYLSFFPHLVAGPIVRASEFLPQLKTPRDPSRVAVGSGLVLIGLGLVKKVVIADYLARAIVDPVFAVPQLYSAPDVLLAAYAYTAQIYCDFSGYTDIAIGLALLMGYVFPQNFRSPYRATGFRDFWRRWHMTLSRFLRDFLYIPLGGSRGGRLFTYRNLMITMVLGGLWHGAAWTFVAWGTFHGIGLVGEHALGGRINDARAGCGGWSPSTSWSSAGSCSGPPNLNGRRIPVAPQVPGPASLWSPAVLLAIVVVVGRNCCLPIRSSGYRSGSSGDALSRCSVAGLAGRDRRRHRVRPGRRPVHLLPLLGA